MNKQLFFLIIPIFFAAALHAQVGIKPVTDTNKAGRANDRLRTAGPKDDWRQTNNSKQIDSIRSKIVTLPSSTQTGFKQIIALHSTGPIDYRTIETEVKDRGLDLSSMPIEDAVMMILMLTADDAREDIKGMLDEMNKAKQKRSALRQEQEQLKKEMDSLKTKSSFQYRPDSLLHVKRINEKTIKLQQNSSLEKDATTAENKTAQNKAAAEDHLRSVEDAIINLQQLRSRKKIQ